MEDEQLVEGVYNVLCCHKITERFVGVVDFWDRIFAFWLVKENGRYRAPFSPPIEIPLSLRNALCSDVYTYFPREYIMPRLNLVERGLKKVVGNLRARAKKHISPF
jgi:hypothetical protein